MPCLLRKLVAAPAAAVVLCAIAVHAQQAPALKQPSGEISGSLVIVGGGDVPDAVREQFLQLAGGKNAKLVVIPTASASADGPDADKSLEPWKKREVNSVVLFHTRKRDQAEDAAFLKPLTQATGVWLGGGDQSKLTAAYRGTLVEKELHKLLERGGVIGGT